MKRKLIRKIPLCACGCGEEVKWNYRHKRWNKVIYHHTVKGRKLSEEHKRKISESNKGTMPWMKGRHHTKEAKIKISEASKGNTYCAGRKLSEEHKRKISESGMGRKKSKETIDKFRKTRAGYRHSEETKRKLSESHKGLKIWNEGLVTPLKTRKRQSKAANKRWCSIEERIKVSCTAQGIKREDWTHFVASEDYCEIWTKEYKEFIRERDGNKCNCPNCKNRSKILDVHHIDYNKNNCNPFNLITLCRSCHMRTIFNRDYWCYFYNEIQKKRGFI